MQILGVIIFWLIIAAISNIGSNKKKKVEEKNKFFPDRKVDTTKDLIERNIDIINDFIFKIKDDQDKYRYYDNVNRTRDCINLICIAETRQDIAPNSKYLSSWKMNAPKEWIELSEYIEEQIQERKREITKIELDKLNVEKQKNLKESAVKHEIASIRRILNARKNSIVEPSEIMGLSRRNSTGTLFIEDLDKILDTNKTNWYELESEYIKNPVLPGKIENYSSDINLEIINDVNSEINIYNQNLEQIKSKYKELAKYFSEIKLGYQKNEDVSVVKRFDYVIQSIKFPPSLPKNWKIEFEKESKILLVDVQLPDVVHNQIYKKVILKSGTSNKPLSSKEIKEKVPNIQPAIMLRFAKEIFINDIDNIIDLLVVNGWVEFDDPNTGNKTKTYTSSFAVKKGQVIDLNLSKLDPVQAFQHLKGKSAGKLIDIIPIVPVMVMDKNDKRFIETKKVIDKTENFSNLASMDWQDFESLIAELFQKEFSKEGVEVKVTQASRDRGVDAVIFDPDPIKGGKYIVQAKRYTNTVDVSAVRDLCAVVRKEGASRGILVTTSTYGSDAYAFAQNEPVTLLNGSQLLGLLEKHGYNFKINLAEARRLTLANEK